MLSRQNRLVSKFDFLSLKRSGQTVFAPFFNFSCSADSQGGKRLRFGFIISTKIDKRATVRNRTKRLFREAVRLFLKEKELNDRWQGLMGVFIIKRSAVGKNYEEISSGVNQVLSKVFKF